MSNLINNEWLENQKNSDCLDLKLLEKNLKIFQTNLFQVRILIALMN